MSSRDLLRRMLRGLGAIQGVPITYTMAPMRMARNVYTKMYAFIFKPPYNVGLPYDYNTQN